MGTLIAATPDGDGSTFKARKPQQERSIDGTRVPVDPNRPPGESVRNATPPAAVPSWPRGGRAVVDIGLSPPQARADGTDNARSALVQATGLPVRVGSPAASVSTDTASRSAAATSPTRLAVQVEGREAVRRAGLDGLLFSLRRADGAEVPGTVAVEVDYGPFRSANGAGWADRLHLAQFPACVLTTPEIPECRVGVPLPTRNDARGGTLSADVRVIPDTSSSDPARSAAGPQDTGSVFAVTAGTAGNSGDFKATSLAPSGSWAAGGNAGSFTWNTPIPLPQVPGSLVPGLALGYSSANVDGRTSATASQPSVIGEGWGGLEQGFVERRYRNCKDDKDTPGSNTTKDGDLCWIGGQYVVMSLNGKSTELVRDEASGAWRPAADDGSRIEHLTGTNADTANGDDGDAVDGANEYWRVTSTDGTQYWFGKNRLPTWTAGKPETNSVYTEPVFGNNPGEPGHQAAFADSAKTQAWRWNLDFVTDVHGNASVYYFAKEENFYAKNGATTATAGYTRGGYPIRIEYGHRADRIYSAPAPAKVEFGYAERCLSACDTFDKDHAENWPDTPVDLNCESGKTCYVASPTFWTRKRLTRIDTSVWSGTGTAYTPADGWALEQTLPGSGDRGGRALWLSSITRTAKAPGSAPITLPPMTFEGTLMPNRVDGAEGLPPLYKYRLTRIASETGADTLIDYSAPDCTTANLPTADTNTRRCYPVWWTPDGYTAPLKDWFHKYVVTRVQEDDLVAGDGSPTTVTAYEYVGPVAWHRDEDEFTLDKHRTWSEFRGYGAVRVRKGAGNPTLTETIFFRGMDGDKLADNSARSVQVQGIPDRPEFNGSVREEIGYDKDTALGGAPATSKVNEPQVLRETATRPRRAGLPALTAHQVRPLSETVKVRLSTGSWQSRKTTHTYDSDGLSVTSGDEGDASVTGDESCTRTTYVRSDRTAWLIAFPASEQTAADGCSVPATPANIIAESRNFYDNRALGEPPAAGMGNVTRREGLERFEGTTPVYGVAAVTTYDVYGRPLSVVGEDGQSNSTAYVPAEGATPREIRVTNPRNWTGSTQIDPVRGLTLKSVDVNGRGSTSAFDALGRLTSVWLNGRPTSAPANMLYSYAVNQAAPSVVTTRTLLDDGSYHTELTVSDGLLRPRQTQSQVADGRVVTDTFYDDQGRKNKQNAGYFNRNPPAPELLSVADNQIPSQTVVEFDGMSRETASVFKSANVERWRTTTLHGGNWIATVPPAGGTSVLKITDVLGQTVEVREYKDANPADGAPVPAFDAPPSAFDATRYGYDKAGNRTRVVDAGGNTWTYEFDLRSRQVKTTDPDQGVSTRTYVPSGEPGADQVRTSTDPRGQTVAYTYDELGRRTSLRDGGQTGALRAEWGYDPPGALGLARSSTRIANGLRYVSETIGYDPAGHPTGVKVTIPSAPGEEKLAGEYTTTSTFTDGIALLDTMTYSRSWGGLPAETLNYGYTKFGLANSLASGNTHYVGGTVYSPFGEPIQTQFGNVGRRTITSMSYAEDTRRPVRTVTDREAAGPQTLDDLNYTYDQAGNIVRIANVRDDATASDTQCFGYDYRRRMTEAWSGIDNCANGPAAGTTPRVGGIDAYWTSYTFDAVGNRVGEKQHDPAGVIAKDVTRTYNTQGHRLNSVDTTGPGGSNRTSYGYDPGGNTTRRTVNGDDQAMTWDPEGRLATSTTGVGAQAKTGSFVYDPDGTRLLRREPDAVTLYLGTTELKLDRVTNTVTGTRYYPGAGGTFVRTSTGQNSVLVTDHHGTSQLAIDYASRNFTRRASMPYGDPRGTQPAVWPDDKGFLGGPKDSSTGLTHLGAREYDPGVGRFLSRDPVTVADDSAQLNPYTYGGGNPVGNTDPSGMGWGKFFKKAAKVAAVAVAVAVVVTVVVAAPILIPAVAGAAAAGAGVAGLAAAGELGIAAAAVYVGSEALSEGRKPATGRKTDDKCDRNSFPGDTPILLADGSTKRIDQVRLGDRVANTDPGVVEADGRVQSHAVGAVHVTDEDKAFVDITVDGGEGPRTITATADHRFFDATTQAWVAAKDLVPGEELQTPGGRVAVRTVAERPGNVRTYNLTVDNVHTYFVGAGDTAVLVHNDSCEHVVLGMNPYSDKLAYDIRKGENVQQDQDSSARTFNKTFPGNETSGDISKESPYWANWMTGVHQAVNNQSVSLTITLEGVEGKSTEERIVNTMLRGMWATRQGPEMVYKGGDDLGGFGTAWELVVVKLAIANDNRTWGSIIWYDTVNGVRQRVYPAEPNWRKINEKFDSAVSRSAGSERRLGMLLGAIVGAIVGALTKDER